MPHDDVPRPFIPETILIYQFRYMPCKKLVQQEGIAPSCF